jgi:hypothetical protein
MVVTVYKNSDEWAVRAYDIATCEDLRVAITFKVCAPCPCGSFT